jgi:hypothetical protein
MLWISIFDGRRLVREVWGDSVEELNLNFLAEIKIV